ncbi:amino acid ABC transporter permease [Alloyangia pacifica]|uniref:Polar amino acid transport system permease protein n=1 Tax=Alloyangia pacifica TaxID=311180 RepID=A0A1I6VHN5_9RHOB|nr:amino acid ABC transporter permease [Alloyangia pacifica]SDH98515.1 polar amino acid transport system permease protein [Alloyangia pacifica]SFT13195.1 polar amino acid transport system permease protein [Alloyangia pacifica]
MNDLLQAFFNLNVILTYLPDLWKGLVVTVELSVLVVITGFAIGIGLALLRTLENRVINTFIVLYADILRALPPLMLIVVGFFGLPYLGLKPSGFGTAWTVLAMVLSAFTEELVFAGINALPKGQSEAARASGLTRWQVLIYVVLPQAIRLVIAPLTSRTIATVKNTSLASVVAVPDLLAEASAALGYSSNASPLFAAALGYLLILFPLVIFSRRLESRLRWTH